MKNGNILKILKVLPINFNLKSQLEQKAILNSYKVFLKNLNSKIQIIISSKKTDVSKHFEEILQNTNENPQIYEMSIDYINLINQIILEKGTITREFYVIVEVTENIENDILKIKEYLINCGNAVLECNRNQIIDLFKNFLNKRVLSF